eukprot:TRINITY_DN29498_c0_g1_i1.p1 TRINITY_DN29498_c0_g1~~TRINITY_DN29498_c0_g1_i1.p1  ORF type:complete len:934 (-),score=174.97 TRINITY_DN29498_c0_g1_i1:56-2857(-)
MLPTSATQPPSGGKHAPAKPGQPQGTDSAWCHPFVSARTRAVRASAMPDKAAQGDTSECILVPRDLELLDQTCPNLACIMREALADSDRNQPEIFAFPNLQRVAIHSVVAAGSVHTWDATQKTWVLRRSVVAPPSEAATIFAPASLAVALSQRGALSELLRSQQGQFGDLSGQNVCLPERAAALRRSSDGVLYYAPLLKSIVATGTPAETPAPKENGEPAVLSSSGSLAQRRKLENPSSLSSATLRNAELEPITGNTPKQDRPVPHSRGATPANRNTPQSAGRSRKHAKPPSSDNVKQSFRRKTGTPIPRAATPRVAEIGADNANLTPRSTKSTESSSGQPSPAEQLKRTPPHTRTPTRLSGKFKPQSAESSPQAVPMPYPTPQNQQALATTPNSLGNTPTGRSRPRINSAISRREERRKELEDRDRREAEVREALAKAEAEMAIQARRAHSQPRFREQLNIKELQERQRRKEEEAKRTKKEKEDQKRMEEEQALLERKKKYAEHKRVAAEREERRRERAMRQAEMDAEEERQRREEEEREERERQERLKRSKQEAEARERREQERREAKQRRKEEEEQRKQREHEEQLIREEERRRDRERVIAEARKKADEDRQMREMEEEEERLRLLEAEKAEGEAKRKARDEYLMKKHERQELHNQIEANREQRRRQRQEQQEKEENEQRQREAEEQERTRQRAERAREQRLRDIEGLSEKRLKQEEEQRAQQVEQQLKKKKWQDKMAKDRRDLLYESPGTVARGLLSRNQDIGFRSADEPVTPPSNTPGEALLDQRSFLVRARTSPPGEGFTGSPPFPVRQTTAFETQVPVQVFDDFHRVFQRQPIPPPNQVARRNPPPPVYGNMRPPASASGQPVGRMATPLDRPSSFPAHGREGQRVATTGTTTRGRLKELEQLRRENFGDNPSQSSVPFLPLIGQR